MWVQVHGFPLGCVTRQLASEAGAKVGDVLAMDFGTSKTIFVGQVIRVQVLFDTVTPLVAGFFFRRPSRKDVWISFKYERLLEFCFSCGRLGHVLANCIMPLVEWSVPHGFGPKLRAVSTAYRKFCASSTPLAFAARLDIPTSSSPPSSQLPPPRFALVVGQASGSRSFSPPPLVLQVSTRVISKADLAVPTCSQVHESDVETESKAIVGEQSAVGAGRQVYPRSIL